MKCPNCKTKIEDSEIAKHFASIGGKKSKGGGRPLKPESELSPEQLYQRRYYLKRKEKENNENRSERNL